MAIIIFIFKKVYALKYKQTKTPRPSILDKIICACVEIQ